MAKGHWFAAALIMGMAVFAAPQPVLAKDTKPAAAAVALVDLNSATVEQLNDLPGIGPVKAQAIVDGRPYASIDDFASRGIVSASAFDKFKAQVTVAAAPKAKAAKATEGVLDLNTATAEELTALPGIGDVKAKAIVDGRPYTSLKDFASRGIVAASVFDKFKDQVTVGKTKTKAAAAEPPEDASPPEPVGKIDLNSASADELEVLPGIGPVRAKAIVEGRPYTSLSDFESRGIVAKSTIEKFSGAIEVVPVAKAGSATLASDDSQQGTPGQIAARKRIKMCGAQWRAAKAANRVPAGLTWPQYWSQCNSKLKARGY